MNFDLGLDGKVAIVTGGAMGLGKGIAAGLASLGARVAIGDVNEQIGQQTAQEINAKGGNVEFFDLDVTDDGQFQDFVEHVVKRFKRIDILVNNAGIAAKSNCIDMQVADWRRIIDVNLTGMWIGSRAVAPVMIKQKSGKIINMCSMFGFTAMPGLSAYAASKGGVNQLTKALALELIEHNINVNAVAPAYIATELTANMRNDPERYKDIMRRTPIGRLGTIGEVVGPVVFLVSDLANFMVGQTMLVDGGWNAW
ncbi:glucose 1-dehydrogenase [Desulfosporosinus sp. PR]|uniref:SDR family NAD(P)-dependent oxidoreductase n=1 Tax=Candidatus Desulfosporosinus nitrosoreducens TaxID=3401928 RepID=UPI0027FF596C|nr:glucose 1-dehydrogenase [Desulfosporosinus sp. PR]MDQ7093229.1 glucose 1-dehydrogenase [Desulfosporosinus sp. PR]